MTFLNTIIDSEEDAKKVIKGAHEAAEKKIAEAESMLKKDFNDYTETLAADREKELSDQEKELTTLRKNIVEEGEREADIIKNTASIKLDGALTKVLKAFKG